MDTFITPRLFEEMPLKDGGLYLQDLADALEDHPNETVQGLRAILSDTAKRIVEDGREV